MIPLKSIFISFSVALFCSLTANAQYCTPTYSNPCFSPFTNDVIDNFWTTGGTTNITNMDTDCNLLPDMYWFTGMTCSGCPGDVIETNVQCEVDSPYQQGFAIWIDWNANDAFELGEKVYASPGSGWVVYTGTFTIPPSTPPGAYRMRVRSSFAEGGATINPCDLQSYGETEDYEVIVELCNPTICEGDTLELDLGTMPPGPITYAWDPATDISDPFGGPVVNVWPSDTTTYTCTITSPDSTWLVPIEVAVVHPANPYAGLDDTLCHSIALGHTFDATVDVPEAGLDIDWEIDEFIGVGTPASAYSPGDDVIDPTVVVSLPGIYYFVVYVEDLSGYCPAQSDTVVVTFSKPLHTLAKTDPSCFGDSDGTITVTGTGTLPSAEYSIDGGVTWQPSPTFTGLPAGTYTVTSRDVAGCEFSSDITIVDPAEVVITVSSDTLICRNGTATVTASATGGVSFTYDWSIPGDDTGTQTISPVDTPTIITVTAYNELGCASSEASITVTLRDPITLAITENDSICPGFESGATVAAVGGDGAYTYSWTENGSLMPDVTNSITTSPLVNTEYCVTVADGCETTPVTICTKTIINPVPVPAFISDIRAGCDPSTANFDAILNPGDVAVWTIDGTTYNDMPSVSHEFSGVGFYDVSLEITNMYGCVASFTDFDYFEVVDVPHPQFYINPNPTTIFNTTVNLNAEVTGPGLTYEWNIPGGTPSTSTDEDVTVFYPEGIADLYLVELTVTNEYGCFTTIEHYVNILTDVIIYAPNAFTPDGDKYNDEWRVYIDGIDFYDFHCTVFNRWGEIVWESFDANGTWDGTYGNNLAQDGTYVWIIQAKEGTTDKIREFKGTVSILR